MRSRPTVVGCRYERSRPRVGAVEGWPEGARFVMSDEDGLVELSGESLPDMTRFQWRTGRKVGRTIGLSVGWAVSFGLVVAVLWLVVLMWIVGPTQRVGDRG
jgi:hypothetical protein